MLRVLERGQFRSLAHCLCNRSTGRGIEILVSDSPVEMLPASDGGAGEKRYYDDVGGTALAASYTKIKARKHFSALYKFVLVSLVYFEMLRATIIKPPIALMFLCSPPQGRGMK